MSLDLWQMFNTNQSTIGDSRHFPWGGRGVPGVTTDRSWFTPPPNKPLYRDLNLSGPNFWTEGVNYRPEPLRQTEVTDVGIGSRLEEQNGSHNLLWNVHLTVLSQPCSRRVTHHRLKHEDQIGTTNPTPTPTQQVSRPSPTDRTLSYGFDLKSRRWRSRDGDPIWVDNVSSQIILVSSYKTSL